MKKRKLFTAALALVMSFMLVLAGCGNSASSSSSGGAKAVQSLSASDKDLRISVLNVGQADATLIQYKGKNMLIDTGEVDSRADLVKQLKERKVKDIDIIVKLLREVKPHQIYAAGDLADPHGTHRVCTDAVFAAIDLEKEEGAKWLKECRIWMYRGAWAEWEIENIEMAVPMSPEEFSYKREGILKYQSQMSDAPFRDPEDGELSWQRSVERNQAAASIYEQLGLASYEAMETFVQYHPTATDS